jgi:hypothetical protein
MVKKYLLYLVRWQISTPILAVCVYLLSPHIGSVLTTVVANFIGGLIFFWVDKLIFGRRNFLLSGELWEIKTNTACHDCGQGVRKAYRLVKAPGYDRMDDKNPEFRCGRCSSEKLKRIKASSAG